LSLRWNIDFKIKHKRGQPEKRVLDKIEGQATSGQFIALMGSSGAGKSSLLHCLALRNQKFQGQIFVNETLCDERYFSMCGYVYQDDVFPDALTVSDHLRIQADLRMDNFIKKEAKANRIEAVLKQLNLETSQNTVIGNPLTGAFKEGLSGGERKRLSFATELLTNPPIIFGDEVTTGLDASMAFTVIETLRNIVDDGKLAIVTIHQPSSHVLELFTDIILLSKGQVVYHGPRVNMIQYFTNLGINCPPNNNPADYFIDQISVDPAHVEESMEKINNLAQEYRNSSLYQKNVAWKEEIPELEWRQLHSIYVSKFPATWWKQFCIGFERAVKVDVNSSKIFWGRVFQEVVVGAIIGSSYMDAENKPLGDVNDQITMDSKFGLVFLTLFFLLIDAVFDISILFPMEMKLFVREYFAGANRCTAFYASRAISRIPQEIIPPFLCATVTYALGFGFYREESVTRYLWWCAYCVSFSFCFAGLGHLLSALFRDSLLVLIAFPTVTITSMSFGGPLIPLSTLPVWLDWLSYTSFTKYAATGMMINELVNVGPDATFPNGQGTLEPPSGNPEKYLYDNLNVEQDGKISMETWLWLELVIIVGIAVALRIASVILLRIQSLLQPKKRA
jgi:ABC-type multidrug transport system ATPase subunit/ABC-type multidrug transport system permease subunit